MVKVANVEHVFGELLLLSLSSQTKDVVHFEQRTFRILSCQTIIPLPFSRGHTHSIPCVPIIFWMPMNSGESRAIQTNEHLRAAYFNCISMSSSDSTSLSLSDPRNLVTCERN